jgi:hypothetical protein
MLDLESRMEIFGVTLYRDLDDPRLFFHAAPNPQIAVENGRPLFDLFTWNKGGATVDAITGGFLNMAVSADLGSQRTRIENELRRRFGDPVTLAPIPYTRGTARVIALGESSTGTPDEATTSAPAGGGPRFIQKILGAGQPSLIGDNRAIFSFSLSEEGAAFFLGVLEGNVDARPVGVVYELEYIGLLPAYDLEITINFKQSYNYLRSRFTLGTLFFRADIDNIVETLRREEAITIREVARTLELSTPEAMAERRRQIDQLVKELATGAFFQPSLTPGQPRVQGELITAADPTAAAVAEGGRMTSALREGAAAAIAVGMGGTQGMRAANEAAAPPAGAAGTGEQETGGQGTGEQGTGESGTGESGTGAEARPPETAADAWNRLGRPQAAYALKTVSQSEERTVTWNLSQVSAQKQTIAPQNFIQFMASPRTLNRHVHLINLNHPFFQRINIDVTSADVDFAAEGIRQMTVQLRYGQRPDGSAPKDTAELVLRPGSQAAAFTFFADHTGAQSYDYKLIVDYRSDFGIGVDDLRIESDWLTTDARSLALHPRLLGRVLPIELRLAPNLPPDLTELHATVRYVSGTVDASQRIILKPNAPTARVVIRLAGRDEQFSLAQTVFYSDGSSEQLPLLQWPDAESGSAENVLVLAPPATNRLMGDVIMQDPLSQLDAVLVDTRIQSGPTLIHSQTMELTQPGNAGRKVINIRLPQGSTPRLQWQERRIFHNGSVEVEGWREATSTHLLVGIPAATVRTITVRWVGPNPAAIGISLVVVDLRYADPAGDPEYRQETMLMIDQSGESQLQEWKIRLPAPAADSYQWRTTFFLDNGSQVEAPFALTNSPLLVIRPMPA